ncbi:MAG: beta strand repeat-containing protein [Pseudomonadota bacterium]|jgi:uncharacterized repeat protein (TIGR01451 family)/fimbrial isopeptide formation D2 family protein
MFSRFNRFFFVAVTSILATLAPLGIKAASAAPIPTATIQAPAEALLNSTVDVRVSFTNTGDALGYFPMLEVKLPAGIECDAACRTAITITSLGGAPVSVTAFGPAGGSTNFTNPVTGNQVPVTAGQSVLFLSLPVGSVAQNEPAITYSIPTKLSANAALSVPLPINATAVFALGAVPNGTRGPCNTNDTLCTSATVANVSPQVLILEKRVENLFDGATSTGPSYPRRFTLDVTVADTKTTTTNVITDTLPDTFVFSSLPGSNCKANPGSMTFSPALAAGDSCSFTGTSAGGGTFTVTYASITGDPGIDRQMSYTGYIQEFAGGSGAAVVPPSTGATTTSTNSASATYNYDPGSGSIALTSGPVSTTIQQRSLYTTKSITNATTGGSTAKPGDTLTHTLIYDISDYFSFDDLQITDTLGDGQTFVSGSLQVTVFEGSSTGVTRTDTQLLAAAGSPLQPITRNPTTGEWLIDLDLSAALVAPAPNGYGTNGTLTGADDLGADSPTRVVITYQSTIDESFTGPVVGTQTVDGGDVINDTMTADFRVAGTTNRVAINGPTASITITPITNVQKDIAFRNGVAVTSYPVTVSPGDNVTFRLAFTIPTGDVEGFVLKDFLPSPLFDALRPTGSTLSNFIFDSTASNAAPAPGHIHLTTSSYTVTPAVSVVGAENALRLSFTEESAVTSNSADVELLFTVTATNNPAANDLLLVNVAYFSQNSSQSLTPVNLLSAIASLLTDEPKIAVRKSALSVVTGSGTISGTGAAANFTNVTPGSRLRFRVELENIGDYDAFDVLLSDPLPIGLTRVAGSVTFSNCTTGAPPNDTSSGTTVSANGMDIPHGQTCTVEYDATLDATTAFGGTITNTVTSRYASIPGGPLFSPESDTASTTVASPSLTKTLVAGSSSDSATAGSNLRPGESADFDVTITIPPGTAESFTIRERDTASGGTSSNFFENFSAGTVTFPSVENNAACGGLFNFVGNTNVCFELNPNTTQTQASTTEHRVNLGSLTNSAVTNQSFTFRYRATVRSGLTPGAYVNRADVTWVSKNSSVSGETTVSKTSLTATANFTVVRPTLTLAKTSLSTPPLALGQSAEYQVTLTNSGTAIAYDVANIVDTLPPGLGSATLVSATLNGTSVTGASGFSFSQSGQQLTITVRNSSGQASLAVGDTYVVRYTVPLTSAVGGGTSSLVNIATVANYSTGPIDGGPRETLTNVPPASATIAVDSNNITGRVIFSKETASAGQQNGVTGATVTVLGTSFSTTTDANGNFSITGVPDGTYTIRATSPFGDVLSEQTITVTNSDANNVVFQARPRLILTKSTTNTGTVHPGDQINYTLEVKNVGNYPAFQVSNLVDTLAKGLGTASLTAATYNGSSVTGVSGFSFSQSGLVITIAVRNTSNEARLNVNDTFTVSYKVAVNSSLRAASLTIPNSAELASYANSATSGATTESYFDIRCGEVRLETSSDHRDCAVSQLSPTIDSMKARLLRMRQNLDKALALRQEYARAGYCKAADNGCYKCSPSTGRCLNTCRKPSPSADAAMSQKAKGLNDQAGDTITNSLFTQDWTLICSSYKTCSLNDVTTAKNSIESAGRAMSNDMRDILDSCCLRTARARSALRQRRASLRQAAAADLKRLSTLMESYPNPGLVCQ